MLKFKKEYENQTIVLADGTLINCDTIGRPHVQKALGASPWFAYMLEGVATASTDPPVTGGGGAGDPRRPRTSSGRTTRTSKQ